MTAFRRITVKPEQMGGVPCIRGLRIPVATVVGMVADGMTEAAILKAYPDLEAEDIEEALRYAAEAVREGDMKLNDRIVVDPAVMLGKPVIRGTRIPVDLILRKLAEGATREELLDAYPDLRAEDIQAAIAYAANAVALEETILTRTGGSVPDKR